LTQISVKRRKRFFKEEEGGVLECSGVEVGHERQKFHFVKLTREESGNIGLGPHLPRQLGGTALSRREETVAKGNGRRCDRRMSC